jgi:plasmid stabilization system protein ParE
MAYNFSAEQSESYAIKIVNEITRRTRQLGVFPQSGPIEETYVNFPDEYRYLVSGHYKIVYRVEPKEVVIVNIFDTRQNPSKMKLG